MNYPTNSSCYKIIDYNKIEIVPEEFNIIEILKCPEEQVKRDKERVEISKTGGQKKKKKGKEAEKEKVFYIIQWLKFFFSLLRLGLKRCVTCYGINK